MKHFPLVCALVLALAFSFSGCDRGKPGSHTVSKPSAADAIHSDDLVAFDCVFCTDTLSDELDVYSYSHCEFTVSGVADGRAACRMRGWSGCADDFDISFSMAAGELAELQQLLRDQGILAQNGLVAQTGGVEEMGMTISADYADGERLYVYSNSSVPFPAALTPLCEYFERQARSAGCGDELPCSLLQTADD